MSNDGEGLELPPPPPAVAKLRALEKRWGDVVDWSYSACALAATKRTQEYSLGMRIDDLNIRQRVFSRVDRRYHDRLKEIDDTEAAFKAAYRKVRASLDSDAILQYACVIRPIINEQSEKQGKLRSAARLEEANRKSKLVEEREERRRSRLAKKAGRTSGNQEQPRDRDLSQADRTTKATDEGTGDRAITDDRGIHGRD